MSVDVKIGIQTFEYEGLSYAINFSSHAYDGFGKARGSTESTRVGSTTASSGGIG